jgi:hypothetical protein
MHVCPCEGLQYVLQKPAPLVLVEVHWHCIDEYCDAEVQVLQS